VPNVVNFVETFWTIRDAQAIRAAKRMQKQYAMVAAMANKTSAAIGRLGRMVVSPFGAAIGGAAAFGLVRHLLKVGEEAESAKISLTSLLQQASRESKMPFRDFELAGQAAEQLQKRFRELAIDSPVTSKAIRSSFEDTTFFLAKAGLSLEKQAEMARDIAVLDKQMGGQGVAGRDVAQLMKGQIAGINSALLKGIRFDVQKMIKKGDLEGAAKLISEKIRPDPKLLAAHGKSFGGMVSTMKDQLELLKQDAAAPLMEFVSKKLREWLKWFKANRAEAKRFAREVGRRVVGAVKAVIGLVKWIAKHWDTIVATVKTLAVVWIGGKLVAALSTAVGMARSFGVAMSAAAVKAGVAASRMRTAGRIGGLIAVGAGVISEGEAIGAGAAKGVLSLRHEGAKSRDVEGTMQRLGLEAVTPAEANRRFAALQEERKAKLEQKAMEGDKKAKDLLKKQFGKTVDKRGGGGGRRKMKVQTMIVDQMKARDRDFARLSTPARGGRIARESFASRPLAGLGLAVATVGR
jgi:hypothetical protein